MNTWIILRAAGIGSYIALWLAVDWGLISTTSLVTKRVSKPTSILFHGVVASAGLALLVIHLGGLLVDRFMPFGPLDLLIPLRAGYRTLAVTFGVLAMYGMVLVLVTRGSASDWEPSSGGRSTSWRSRSSRWPSRTACSPEPTRPARGCSRST